MKKFQWDKKYLNWGITAFCVIVASIAFFMLLQRWAGVRSAFRELAHILSPLVWGFAIAYLVGPFQRFFERSVFLPIGRLIIKKENRLHAFARAMSIFLALVTVWAIVVALLWLILPQLYSSIESIVVNSPEYIRKAIAWAENLFSSSAETEEIVVSLLGDISNTLTTWIKESILPGMEDVISGITSGLYNVLKGIINVFIGVAISCYVMYNKETFGAHAKKLLYSMFSAKKVEKFLSAVSFTDRTFMDFLCGKLLDSLIIGIICYIVCLILRIPYSLLVSVIVGVTNIIPVFGPFIGTVPAAIIILLVEPIKCLIFVIFIIILQQFDGNVLGPKILGSSTGINGFWIMFAIIVGGGLFGFAGMLLGVPAFVVIYAGIKQCVVRGLKKRGLPEETADYKGIDHIDPDTGIPVMKTEIKEEDRPDRTKKTVRRRSAKNGK